MSLLISLLIAYVLGSIPFGLLLMRIAGQGDVRNIGSGNIGATNVLRSGKKGLAAATLLLDGAKGLLAILVARHMGVTTGLFAVGLAAVLAHIYPVWLKFKGGKGVATAIGAALAISPVLGLCIMAVWLTVFYFTRISSLSALAGFAVNCPLGGLIGGFLMFIFMVLLTGLLCYTHRENIKRLRDGTEAGFRKGGA